MLNDADLRYQLIPIGSRWTQLALYIVLWLVPIITGATGVWVFMKSFYRVKFNEIGISEKRSVVPLALRRKFAPLANITLRKHGYKPQQSASALTSTDVLPVPNTPGQDMSADPLAYKRRTVLIATMEYDIEDWNIKIKIGGLGVMAQLMGKNLMHQDLIWVVPCVGGLDYPTDTPGESMEIKILGTMYEVQVQYHVLRNITYGIF